MFGNLRDMKGEVKRWKHWSFLKILKTFFIEKIASLDKKERLQYNRLNGIEVWRWVVRKFMAPTQYKEENQLI